MNLKPISRWSLCRAEPWQQWIVYCLWYRWYRPRSSMRPTSTRESACSWRHLLANAMKKWW